MDKFNLDKYHSKSLKVSQDSVLHLFFEGPKEDKLQNISSGGLTESRVFYSGDFPRCDLEQFKNFSQN